MTPDFLRLGVAAMDSHPEADTWIAQRKYVDESYCVMARQPARIVPKTVERPLREFIRDYSRFYLFCVWGRVLRKAIIEKHKLRFVDMRISEDAVFMMEYFSIAGTAVVDGEAEVLHCERAGSLVRVASSYRADDLLTAIGSLLAFAKDGNKGAQDLKLCAAMRALGLVRNCLIAQNKSEWAGLRLNPMFKSVVCWTIVRHAPFIYKAVGMALMVAPRLTFRLAGFWARR